MALFQPRKCSNINTESGLISTPEMALFQPRKCSNINSESGLISTPEVAYYKPRKWPNKNQNNLKWSFKSQNFCIVNLGIKH